LSSLLAMLRKECFGTTLHVVLKANEGAVLAPPVPPAPPNTDGLAAFPPGLLKPKDGAAAPPAAPNMLPGWLAAGGLDAPPPNMDEPVAAPPPKRVLGVPVLAPAFAVLLVVPKSDVVAPPEVLLLTAPNSGLSGALPVFCCPKLNDILRALRWTQVWCCRVERESSQVESRARATCNRRGYGWVARPEGA
jgi:hypothetical protein